MDKGNNTKVLKYKQIRPYRPYLLFSQAGAMVYKNRHEPIFSVDPAYYRRKFGKTFAKENSHVYFKTTSCVSY